ncbi:MAG: metal ABC transporter permease [Methanobacteriota archaeon]|nr:MAG: metal ABC transporter permease [Euryarchaeota archaeon]
MADLVTLFQYGFMQRALLAGLLISVVCGLLGVFVVLRRTAPLGDALAHVSFGGVALGIAFGFLPLYVAIVVAVAGGIAMRLLQERRLYGELSLMIVQAAGLAGGIVLVSLVGGLNVDILSFLFAPILTVAWSDVTLIVGLLAVTVAVLAVFYKEFFLVTFDPEGARVSGLPVRALDLGFTVLTAVTVVLAMRVVGILLVSALIVVPAATALQLRLGLRGTLVAAVAIASLCVAAGLVLSVFLNAASGGMIVLVSIAALLASMATAGASTRAVSRGPRSSQPRA